MKRKVNIVLGPFSERHLEARQCTYGQLEVETQDDSTQRVIAVSIENVGPEPGNSEYFWNSSATILDGHHIDALVGKLLTYVDATFSDKDQRKAHKDIVRQIAWDWFNHEMRHCEKTIDFSEKLAKGEAKIETIKG